MLDTTRPIGDIVPSMTGRSIIQRNVPGLNHPLGECHGQPRMDIEQEDGSILVAAGAYPPHDLVPVYAKGLDSVVACQACRAVWRTEGRPEQVSYQSHLVLDPHKALIREGRPTP